MGIQGLLPLLKSIMAPINVEELRGQTVAVDTYSWLHKGALACSAQLCKGIPTTKHVDYCMHRVNLLRHHGVKPILVFDGGLLPMKMDQEMKRSRARKENLERAMVHEESGNTSAAFECYQKAVDISPSIAFELIQVLKHENVDYIVAPYEADAQLTFLSVNKFVDAVITEDSDLIPFGCSRIIFKMDKFGQGVEFQSSKIGRNKDLDFTGFTKQMLLEMCIFSGCDYLQSLPGMGLKRAHALLQKLKNFERVIKHLRYSAVCIPPLYEENFKKAMLTFQHQRVYDPVKEDIVHLLDIPPGLDDNLDFLGPWLSQSVVKGISKGDLDPLTKMPLEATETCTELALQKSFSVKEFVPAHERKKLNLPVQKNNLTNYFCLASLEAKRKFMAPKVVPKHIEGIDSLSPSSVIHVSDTPSSAEEAAAIDHPQGILLDSENTKDERPSQGILLDSENTKDERPSGDSLEDMFTYKSTKVKDISHNREKCVTGYPHSTLVSNHAHKKLSLSSHKETNYNTASDISASNTKSENRKDIVRSKFFKHKLSDENHEENNPIVQKRDFDGALGESLMSRSASFGHGYRKNTIKKRKVSHVHAEDKEVPSISAVPEAGSDAANSNNGGVGVKTDGNLSCEISHLKKYSGIAEKSMERFVSVISSFRYTSSGSRASGLRAPLKDVQNTRIPKLASSSTTGPVDFSKYRFVPKEKKSS